ncbi:helix-turn-helix domain-containing protein [Fischerella thermalis]|uniref:helix-turn-helix domain-containing protein n=1 Tax=Fischerella thermalis TaxID=372787 RepID=UPI0019E7355D|nr:RodZ domain-containing protein [Fischerella thermalis]MBF1990418.1 helix-turn-helix domain-containing protein [Fischerella thermalis M58_A2018_009]MBF2060129.1 helix-turn-helix domain-containing protein [Fischerella thermalis M66_A2018_004]
MNWLSRKNKNKHELTTSLDQQRREKLAAMGAQLRSSRQEKGLSLDEMVVLTRIPRRLLQAIEEGNLAELPEPVYIQGLIRRFADALGSNGAEFASSFPIGTHRVSLKSSWKRAPIGELRPLHLYILYIFMILFSVGGLSQLLNANALQATKNNQNQPNQNQETVIQSQKFQPVSDINKSVNPQQVQIGLTLTEKSWIQVLVDGKVEYEGELPEGTHKTWKAQEQLTVRTNNAGGVLVSINKEKAKQLGEPGKQKEVTIAANTRF